VKLVIIRHAAAGDRAEWEAEGRDDRVRPLTADGKKKMQRAASGLATIVDHLDALATSPLVRAVQTAEIVARVYGCKSVTVDDLSPGGDPDKVVTWLGQQGSDGIIGLVGHEPDLTALIGYFLTEKRSSFIDLKKGAACLLDFAERPEPGTGTLEWVLPPRLLSRLSE
jgi:phosphohistidine phosphatase